jgi:hypothetical protein
MHSCSHINSEFSHRMPYILFQSFLGLIDYSYVYKFTQYNVFLISNGQFEISRLI